MNPLLLVSLILIQALIQAGCTHEPTHGHDADNLAQSRSLSGTWSFLPGALRPADPQAADRVIGWRDIQVPDNWYRQGHDMHGKVWFRRTFVLDESDTNKQIQLVFNGIDYAADVWLNNQHLGHHEGYFQVFDFDLTPYARPGQNTLHVLVDSPIEDSVGAWSLNKRLIKGIYSHHDTRPGGAWSPRGQEKNTGGIWAPVTLEIADKVMMRTLNVNPIAEHDGLWLTRVEAKLSGQVHAASSAEISITPENFEGAPIVQTFPIILQPDGTLKLDVAVKNPKLWWPHEHGTPHLYRLRLTLRDGEHELHRKDVIFGYREFKVDPVTQAWHINGKRLFIRGTNYISTQWLAEMNAHRYAHDLLMMTNAHFNTVRVHAHIEAPAFYEACDRAGLLVLQDFPLQWGYVDSEEFIAEARRQARDMVVHLSNHPSIVTWSMHNEPPWDADWMKWKYPDYNPNQNRQLDEMLEKEVSNLDPSRETRKISSTVEHPWLGWYSGDWKDYGKPTTSPWITEFGAQALPDVSSLRRIFNEEELWPDNDSDWAKWSFHNFQRRETFDIAKVPMGSTIQEFVNNTQQYQAKLIKLAAESYRQQRYRPVTAAFQFMFVEDWPSFNWGIVDYWRNPKPGYAAIKTAFQPVLPSIQGLHESYLQGAKLELRQMIINDLWHDFPSTRYSIELRNPHGLITRSDSVINLANDALLDLGSVEFETSTLPTGDYSLVLHLQSAAGLDLGHNTYAFKIIPGTPKPAPRQ